MQSARKNMGWDVYPNKILILFNIIQSGFWQNTRFGRIIELRGMLIICSCTPLNMPLKIEVVRGHVGTQKSVHGIQVLC